MAEIVEGVHYLTVDDLVEINRSLIELQTPDEPVGVLSPDNLSSSQARPAWFDGMNRLMTCLYWHRY